VDCHEDFATNFRGRRACPDSAPDFRLQRKRARDVAAKNRDVASAARAVGEADGGVEAEMAGTGMDA
jgi:hypothetical protein